MQEFHFPNWVNKFTIGLVIGGALIGGYLATCLFAAVHPTTVNVGYQPKQPVPFSHKLHVGQLKFDCRYCHNTVEQAGHAAIPATATCGNCHGGNRVKKDASGKAVSLSNVHINSELLEPVRKSLETMKPIHWIRVHNLPDFVYFNHSAHINQGVSCVSCHGRIDKMEVVTRVKSLSMKWCLDCHRNPEKHLRPAHLVTKLDWNPDADELKKVFFESLDVDKDGFLSQTESRPGFVLPKKDMELKKLDERFARTDRDGDQRISPTELFQSVGEIDRKRLGTALRMQHGIRPQTNCSTCHR